MTSENEHLAWKHTMNMWKEMPMPPFPSMMLRARLLAFWHQLFGLFSGHRIWQQSIRPARSWFYRTQRVFCSCGKEFK